MAIKADSGLGRILLALRGESDDRRNEVTTQRGLKNDWVDVCQCDTCGAIYMDISLYAAQKMHDDNEPCEGEIEVRHGD